jgi:hypothetical protein
VPSRRIIAGIYLLIAIAALGVTIAEGWMRHRFR